MADERLNARATAGAGTGETYREITATYDSTTEKNSLDVRSVGSVLVSGNSTSTPLSAGATFTGSWTDSLGYATLVVSCKTDQAGSLFVDFSTDASNADSTLTYSVAASTNELHRLTITKRYFRVRFTNTAGSAQTYLRLQLLVGNHPLLTSSLNSTITSDADSIITRSIIYGQDDGGNFRAAPVTPEGHQEVAIHDPILPFKSVHTENISKIFQFDAVYQINSQLVQSVLSGSGGAVVENSSFKLTTGTTVASSAVLTSRKRLRYRPGQGSICRFTTLFPQATADFISVAGLGHAEDGYFFATSGTSFGILKSSGGTREVRTLTITTGSSTNENVTVRLNGTNYSVAVTNSGNIQRTVWEISQGSFGAWYAEPVGATVRFINNSVGLKDSGTYTLTGSTAVGTFAQTRAGSSNTDTFVAQADWNGDKLDGTGGSGITLDYKKYNIYQIDMAYLGAGNVDFKVMVTPTSGNNPIWVTCHTIRNTNSLTNVHTGNPSMPFTAAVYSAGSTTDLTMKVGSVMGAIEGEKQLHGNRLTYFAQSNAVGDTNLKALFTIKNDRYFQGRTNQAVINLMSVSGAIKHTSPVIYYLIKNGSLTGNPNFAQLTTISPTTWDNAATNVTYSTGEQLLWTGHLGDTGELDHHFNGGKNEEVTLQPGEWVTLAAKATTGSPSWVTGSINTREDQ